MMLYENLISLMSKDIKLYIYVIIRVIIYVQIYILRHKKIVAAIYMR